MKGKMYAFEKKRKKKQNSQPEEKSPANGNKRESPEDSLSNGEAGNVEHIKFLLIFKKETPVASVDSIFIFYYGKVSDVNEAGKARLEALIEKLYPDFITKVLIREIKDTGAAVNQNQQIERRRTRKIKKFLRQCGINSSKIKIVTSSSVH
jgi:hypothetical protein